MWSALRKLIGFLFSKGMAIFIVCLLVIGAVALWLFGQHQLEQHRDEVEAARLRVEEAGTELEQRGGEVAQLVAERDRLEAQIGELEAEAQTQGEALMRRFDDERDRAAELGREVAEVNETMAAVADRLDRLLGPFEETDWMPGFVRNQAAEWRDQLSDLAGQRDRLERRLERSQAAAGEARERRDQLLEDTREQVAEAREVIAGLREHERSSQQGMGAAQSALQDEERELSQAELRLARWEGYRDSASYWLHKSWDAVKWYLLIAVATWLFGPLVLRTLVFYLWAPLVDRAPPVRLQVERGSSLVAGESAPARKLWLEPGEVAVVHERFLQSSDEPLRRRTQWLWSWRYPFTSFATGMVLMTRLSNAQRGRRKAEQGEGDGGERPVDSGARAQLTLSSQEDEAIELAVIELPAGARLACRPRFLAGLIHAEGQPPQVRSRWVFGRLHSWVTLQFRHFIFEGPVKLVLAAGRGVQVEEVDGRSRRTNEDLTIAFEPWLNYRSRRCETFMAYLRGQNPLFDDLFQGEGTFLAQQVRRRGADGDDKRNFWQDFFGLFFKALGL